MTGWSELFLAAIAFATMVMALIQVGAIVYAGLLVKRVNQLADRVEHEIQPLYANLLSVTRDAAKTSSLVVAQVERADRLMTDFTERAEQTMTAVQAALVAPAREGLAMLSGLRAAIAAIREIRERVGRGPRPEDEDALFI